MLRLDIPAPILVQSKSEYLQSQVQFLRNDRSDLDNTVPVHIHRLSESDMEEVSSLALSLGAKKFHRVIQALRSNGEDSNWKVPSFGAFEALLTRYLARKAEDGLIWSQGADGTWLPLAITAIKLVEPSRHSDASPQVRIMAAFWGMDPSSRDGARLQLREKNWNFGPGDVSNRTVASILQVAGIRLSDPDLLTGWKEIAARFEKILDSGFSRQFRVTEMVAQIGDTHTRANLAGPIGHKVICDTSEDMLRPWPATVECEVMQGAQDPVDIELPRHPYLKFFDLHTHEFIVASAGAVEAYTYDKALRGKLVLPDSHRDILDVLTCDIGALTSDFIEGKSAGNIILAKGPAGTGKTLTAEVYAELMELPLYRVHAGTLGTSAAAISKSLTEVFQRAGRWGCALLIDEADVFVMRRGDDLERNAVTAEFLRVLEYFPGLIFMTTNRPHDIDDAVISRCAAVIHYSAPTADAASRIWQSQAENFGYELERQLIGKFVASYPLATGRDIKQLLRQAIRYAGQRTEDGRITPEIMNRVAIFRGIELTASAAPSEGGAT
ncbi:ATP-binding protein [Paracoccus litorisediminis]|uniref:ATP-binding protein n=1 Tax=Paracoccus litorisediminis TaxID=2006130 RepID=UPI003731B993